jgi:hypothetical protein
MGLEHEQSNPVYTDGKAAEELERRIEEERASVIKSAGKVPSRDELISRIFKADRAFHERWRREGRL